MFVTLYGCCPTCRHDEVEVSFDDCDLMGDRDTHGIEGQCPRCQQRAWYTVRAECTVTYALEPEEGEAIT